jgi:hypothetical protein
MQMGGAVPKSRYSYDLPVHHVNYGVEVKISDLKIDSEAQRTLNEGQAQSIANNLVKEAIGPIVVSKRANNDLYIVDGQHRWRVCALAGIRTIRAEIHEGLNQPQEAVLFLIKNRESHKPRPLDEYRVGLTGKVPLFVDTDRVLSRRTTSGSAQTRLTVSVRFRAYFGLRSAMELKS